MKRSIFVATVLLLLLALGAVSASSTINVPQQEATYVGSQTCRGCHPAIYTSWQDTLHAWKLRPKAEANIVADFESDDPDLTFTLDDVDYVIGASGRGWKQRFIKVMEDGGWRVLPAQWNIATQEWVPYHPDDWQDRDYKVNCIGCHTTGFDVDNPEANGGLGFVDFGIACEACHGPGSLHAAGGFTGEPGNRQIRKSVSAEICAGCHVRGKTKEGLYDVRYGWPEGYIPLSEPGSGTALEDVYDLDWSTGKWWYDNPEDAEDPGHAKSHHQQYMEWENGGHAQALADIAAFGRDFCLACHSEDYRRDPENVTIETAQFPITCVTCHSAHDSGVEGTRQLKMDPYETCVQCHNGDLPETGKFEPGEAIHHPMQEMFEGIGFPGVDDMPSAHFSAEGGPVCSSCHFPRTAKSAVTGDITSHMQTDGFVVAMPGDVKEGEPDSCTGCHTGATRERMQRIIDNRQDEIHSLLDDLQVLLDANDAISNTIQYQTAELALEFVEEEGSFGIHNYWYAKAVLDEGFEQLGQALTQTDYAGYDACVGCHSYSGNTPEITLHFDETLHPWKLRPKDEANIVADFTSDDPDLTFTLDDVDYVIGASGRGWKQRFITVMEDGGWRVLPAQWNLATSDWTPYHAENDEWLELDYKVLCTGCHNTGVNVNDPEMNRGRGFVDFGVTCEACHGPGREHALSMGDETKITKSVSSEVCAGCHVRGKTKEGLYDVRYGWPEGYVPLSEPGSGTALEDVYDLDWSTGKWWYDNPEDESDPGHAKAHHQQYMEWDMSAHSEALDGLKASEHAQDFCLGCHSEDARRDATVSVDTAEFSIECVTCHATHDPGAEGTHQLTMSQYETCVQCHNGGLTEGGTFEPGATVHHPMQEMFEGRGAIGVADAPSMHFTAESGPICSSCHLVKTAKSAAHWVEGGGRVILGDISSHLLKPALPGNAKEGQPDTCSQCHYDRTVEANQGIIDAWQNSVKGKLAEREAQRDRLSAAKGVPAWDIAYTNISIVESEGSFGVHNNPYAVNILDVAKAKLDSIKQIRLSLVRRNSGQ